MQFEIGREYVTGRGDRLRLVARLAENTLPLVFIRTTQNARESITQRTEEGTFWTDKKPSMHDIVGEYKEPQKFKLKAIRDNKSGNVFLTVLENFKPFTNEEIIGTLEVSEDDFK
jgi:hypothetical protein